MKKHFLKITALCLSVMVMGLGCKGLSSEEQAAVRPIQIEYWSVFADSAGMRNLIARYNATHPQVRINFRTFRAEEYEDELLNALAEDRGPDIFSLHHERLKEYQSKITPMPAEVTVPTVVYGQQKQDFTGQAQQPDIQEVRFDPTRMYSVSQFARTFVDGVVEDVVFPDGTGAQRIWGVPLSYDTLQLFYNQELLDKAGIPEPPKTWDEFNQNIARLRQLDPTTGQIVQAAAGLGRYDNVARAADILMLLMRQNGAIVQDENGTALFDRTPSNFTGTLPPGPQALAFYTDFANPAKNEVYTWNGSLPNSLDMFARGNLAYFFGYAYHRDQLFQRAPKLNYQVTNIPQLNQQPVNMANYWVEAVSKKSDNADVAWHFLEFITRAQNIEGYLKQTELPTAVRSLVQTQLDDEDLEPIWPFVQGVLTARGWYDGNDYSAAENVILSMIRRVIQSEFQNDRGNIYIIATRDAVQQVNSTR